MQTNNVYHGNETADRTEITPEQQMVLEHSHSYGNKKGANGTIKRPESSYGKKNRGSPPSDFDARYKKTASDLKSQVEVYDLKGEEFRKVFSTPKMNINNNPYAKKPPRI
jgi:hypothetical protein